MARSTISKPVLIFSLGLLAVIGLLEAALRIHGPVDDFSYRGVSSGEKILVVSDFSTKGLLAKPGYLYPEQLRALLSAHFPGSAPQVLNGSESGLNSAELLDELPFLFKSMKPNLLVVMAGEANLWNRHLALRSIDRASHLSRFFSRWKSAQLVSRYIRGEGNSSHAGFSVWFDDVPIAEFPTLAMRWTGMLNAPGGFARLTKEGEMEAEASIHTWLEDSRSGPLATSTRVLAELELRREQPERALRAITEYVQRGGLIESSFFRWIIEVERARAEFKDGALWASLLRDLKQKNTLSTPVLAASSGPTGAREVFMRELRENPFYAGGELPPYEFHTQFSETEFRNLLSAALPPGARGGEKPALSLIRECFLTREEILAWARRDLDAIVQLARDNGVSVLLQTYPPERFSGREHPIDSVIRYVASSLNVPLSDTSRELSRLWDGRALDQFYGAPGSGRRDDHLNREGNGLVAGLLLEDLQRFHLLVPRPPND